MISTWIMTKELKIHNREQRREIMMLYNCKSLCLKQDPWWSKFLKRILPTSSSRIVKDKQLKVMQSNWSSVLYSQNSYLYCIQIKINSQQRLSIFHVCTCLKVSLKTKFRLHTRYRRRAEHWSTWLLCTQWRPRSSRPSSSVIRKLHRCAPVVAQTFSSSPQT